MSKMMWAMAAALWLASSLAWAQSPAPSVHPGTKLSFAPTVGGARLEQSTLYPAVSGGHEAIYSYVYSIGRMQIFIDVFDNGRRAPTGTSSPLLTSQFNASLGDSEQQLKTAGFARFEKQTVASTCTFGSVAFRCIVFSAVSGASRLFSKMMMTGYHDSFVKIAINWSQANGQTVADADKALNEFVPALFH
jgi:hypothetical protein